MAIMGPTDAEVTAPNLEMPVPLDEEQAAPAKPMEVLMAITGPTDAEVAFPN